MIKKTLLNIGNSFIKANNSYYSYEYLIKISQIWKEFLLSYKQYEKISIKIPEVCVRQQKTQIKIK